jgi:hypothetical protein
MSRAHGRNGSMRARLGLACLVAMLALPVAASAMPPRDPAVALRNENGFPLAGVHHAVPASTEPVARTITISRGSSALPVVLASLALGIALTGTAYVTVRLRPVR